MTTSTEKSNKEHQWIYLTGKEIYQFYSRIKGRLQGMHVYALVGKSGTGKSFRAKLLAEKIGVPLRATITTPENRPAAARWSRYGRGSFSRRTASESAGATDVASRTARASNGMEFPGQGIRETATNASGQRHRNGLEREPDGSQVVEPLGWPTLDLRRK